MYYFSRKQNSDDETYITFNYSENGCYTSFIVWFKNGLVYRPGNGCTVNLGKTGCFGVTTIQHDKRWNIE